MSVLIASKWWLCSQRSASGLVYWPPLYVSPVCDTYLRTHFPTCKVHFDAPRAERHVSFYVFSLAPFMYCALCLFQFPRSLKTGSSVSENEPSRHLVSKNNPLLNEAYLDRANAFVLGMLF